MEQQNNDAEIEEMLDKFDEINKKKMELKEKLYKTIGKMAEIERKMKKEMDDLTGEIGDILDEERTLLGQFEKIKERQKQSGNESSIPASIQELMQQRKGAVIEEESDDSLAIEKSEYSGIRIQNSLIDSLCWMKRSEMADSALSTSSRAAFNGLCWPKLHGNVEPYLVKPLGFHYEEDEFGNARPILYQFQNGLKADPINMEEEDAEIIPIVTAPPPEYILGFGEIHLWYLDGQVIQFMENVNIKVKTIRLIPPTIDMSGWERSQQIMAIHRLLATFSGKIYELDFITTQIENREVHLEQFHANFPYIFDETQRLTISSYDETRTNFIINWLTTKRRLDGKHRLLWLSAYDGQLPQFIEKIKEEFAKATEPNAFLIKAGPLDNFIEFTMENEQTDEVLTFYMKVETYEEVGEEKELRHQCIARFKKGDSNMKTEMEKSMFDYSYSYYTEIDLNIEKFGTFPTA